MTQFKFKDVAHLYVGCNGVIIKETSVLLIDGNGGKKIGDTITIGLTEIDLLDTFPDLVYFKPLLRPLPSITEQQNQVCGNLHKIDKWGMQTPESMAQITLYLTKEGFDLFNLIESGEALDITTINQ